MAKISRETAIEHLADIAIHYLTSYKEVQSWNIDDYGADTRERDLKELAATCERDMNRIEYLRTVIEEERNNDHDTAKHNA